MVLQFKREQYKLGEFKYVMNSGALNGSITFDRMNAGRIVVRSDDMFLLKEMQMPPLFGKTEKTGNETRQMAGMFECHSGEKGVIYYCGKKGSNFLNGIYFWVFKIDNQEYTAYEVGFGRKGIYLCIWHENQILAIVSKDVHTKRFESNYTIYAEDYFPVDLASVCSLFWDLSRYYPTSSSEEFHTLNTWQKELKNKYDSDFLNRMNSKSN